MSSNQLLAQESATAGKKWWRDIWDRDGFKWLNNKSVMSALMLSEYNL